MINRKRFTTAQMFENREEKEEYITSISDLYDDAYFCPECGKQFDNMDDAIDCCEDDYYHPTDRSLFWEDR